MHQSELRDIRVKTDLLPCHHLVRIVGVERRRNSIVVSFCSSLCCRSPHPHPAASSSLIVLVTVAPTGRWREDVEVELQLRVRYYKDAGFEFVVKCTV